MSCSSLSGLYLPGESVSCQMHGESVGWWSNIILCPRKTGIFQRGSARHVDVASFRGSTRQVGRLQVQGLDTSRRWHLTGARHLTLLPPQGPTRVQIPSVRLFVGKFLPSAIQPIVPIPSKRFFSFSIHRIRHCAHFDTYSLGAFGRNGSHGKST